MRYLFGCIIPVVFILFCGGVTAQIQEYTWETIETKELPNGRHENAFIGYKGKFYLIGGGVVFILLMYLTPKPNVGKQKENPPLKYIIFKQLFIKTSSILLAE